MKLLLLFQTDYGMALAVSALAALIVGVLMREKRMSAAAPSLTVLLSALLCPVFARAYYILVRNSTMLFRTPFFSAYPYEYAFSGAVLGFMAAIGLAALVLHEKPGRLADSMTIPALLMVTLARLAQAFSDFGWGPRLSAAWAQRPPIGIQDELWGEWHLATFNLSALIALTVLIVLILRLIRRGSRKGMFATGLLWWSMGQIFCETLRAECIRWGFVPVQQLHGAITGLVLLLICALLRKEKRFPLRSAAVYLACVGLVVFLEFAMDKCPWPLWIDYTGLAAVLVLMGITVQQHIDMLPEGDAKQ